MTRTSRSLAGLCFSLALSGALLAESPKNQPSNTAARAASEHRAVLDRYASPVTTSGSRPPAFSSIPSISRTCRLLRKPGRKSSAS